MKHASPKDVEQLINDGTWPAEWLPCRAGVHDWRPNAAYPDRRKKTITRTQKCARCGTVKSDVLDARTGEILKRNPGRYPDGYLSTVGRITGPAKGKIRLAATLATYDMTEAPPNNTRTRKGSK